MTPHEPDQSTRPPHRVGRFFKILTWSALLAGLASLAIWGVWSREEWLSRRLMLVAEAKWRQDDFLGAMRDYEKIIDAYPKSNVVPEAYYWKGVGSFLYFDDPKTAVAALQKVIQLESARGISVHDISAQGYLAEIYEKALKQPTKAIIAHEEILYKSHDADLILKSRYKIGELYYALGDLSQARIEWDVLVEKAPNSRWAPAALYRKAGTYFVTGACEKAVPVYQTLYTEYPEDENSLHAKFRAANCFEMQNQFTEARSLYQSLKDAYPDPKLIEQKVERLDRKIRKAS
ncbi:MAG: tol-pal system YbgF family protein [Nitrospiria bacterium]